jgi:hypothetical protein
MSADVNEIYRDFSKFLRFLELERRLLLDAGLVERDVDDILSDLIRVRQLASNFQIDPDAILDGLAALRTAACDSAESIFRSIDITQAQQTILKISLFASGAVLCIVDAVAAFGTLGTSSPIVFASGLGGTALMASIGLF